MVTIREEKEEVLRNPNNAPTGNYFEYAMDEIEFCCDKMREKEGTKDLHLIGDRVEGEGFNRLWYCRCAFCGTPLILSRTRLRIDKN